MSDLAHRAHEMFRTFDDEKTFTMEILLSIVDNEFSRLTNHGRKEGFVCGSISRTLFGFN